MKTPEIQFASHLQLVLVTGRAGATGGLLFLLDLCAGCGLLWLCLTELLLTFHWRRRGLPKGLICRRPAVELRLRGRRLNFFHGQLSLGLSGYVGWFSTLSVSLCQIEFYISKWPLHEDVVEFYSSSRQRNSKLYGVTKPEKMGFISRYAMSIHPHTIETLKK